MMYSFSRIPRRTGIGAGPIGIATIASGACWTASATAATVCCDSAWAISLSFARSEEHTSELQSRQYLVCRLLLEKKNATLRDRMRGTRKGTLLYMLLPTTSLADLLLPSNQESCQVSILATCIHCPTVELLRLLIR